MFRVSLYTNFSSYLLFIISVYTFVACILINLITYLHRSFPLLPARALDHFHCEVSVWMVHDVGVAWINPCYGRTSLVHGLAEHPWSRLRIYKNTTQKATPTAPDCEAVERTYALLSTPLLLLVPPAVSITCCF